jgi:hypothetical protein
MLIDNVVKRSGLDNPKIRVRAQADGQKLKMTTENELGPQVDVVALQTKMDHIWERLGSAESRSMVRKEGGSGIYKITKILAIDLQRVRSHILYEIRDGIFSFGIEMDANGVTV